MPKMLNEDLGLHQLSYHSSRIPALDALVAFVPTGEELVPWLEEARARTGQSRWYPLENGHRVVILYEGGPYDAAHFSVEKGAWDHEHCKRCGNHIAPMSLCWVSVGGPYVILCESCYVKVMNEQSA